jgi:hypothetical protein
MVEGGWGLCAWRNPPPLPPLFVLGGAEGQRVGVRSKRGPSDLTTAGAPRRYPVMEPWGRRGHTPPYSVTPGWAAALVWESPDIGRQPVLIQLPHRGPARETAIYARATRRGARS